MIERCAECLTRWCCREEELKDEYLRAKIQYGIQSTLEFLYKFVFLFVIAVLLDRCMDFTIFIGLFFLLRFYAGGHHSKTSIGCLLSMILIELTALGGMTIEIPVKVQMAGFLMAGVILVWLAPCDTPNNPIVDPQNREIKRWGTILCVLTYFILMILWSHNRNVFFMAGVLEAISVSIGKWNVDRIRNSYFR